MTLDHSILPREVDPMVYNMTHEDPGSIAYNEIGGLGDQLRELREVRLCFISISSNHLDSIVCFIGY